MSVQSSSNSQYSKQYKNILSSQLNFTKHTKTLTNIDIDNNHLNSTFNINEFELIDCSYLKYTGSNKLEIGFVCTECNPTKNLIMCSYCYNNCHRDCTKHKTDSLSTPCLFNCYCGEKLKHKKPKVPSIHNTKPCKIISFDKRVGNKNRYYCSKHNCKICSICAKECHVNCENVQLITDDIIGCECSDINNHNEYNEFTFNYARLQTQKNNINDGVIRNLWPIQVINLLFDTKIYKKLIVLIKECLDSSDKGSSIYKAPFPRIIGMFSETFNSKFKTFYYHEEIMQLFKYSSLINYIKNIDLSTLSSKLLKFRLLCLVLFLHLKKDFQLIKTLTSIDFISGSLLERLLYRKFILSRSIYTEEIIDKYQLIKDINNHPHNLRMFIIKDVCEFMKQVITSELNIEEFKYEFEISFKCICFILKHMLLTKEDIETISDDLFVIQSKLIETLELNVNRNINNNKTYDSIFKYIVELCLLMAVNYNDIVIYDYLIESKRNRYSIYDTFANFIHCKCDAGENIFKMIIRNGKVIKKYFQHEEYFVKYYKIINEYNNGLNLFSIADNFYYKQIINITEEELDEFYTVIYKLDSSFENYVDIFKNHDKKNSEKESTQLQLLNLNKQRIIPLKHDDTILSVKISIEIFLNTYFTSNYEVYYSIMQELEQFTKRINSTMSSITRNNVDKDKENNNGVFNIQQKRMKQYIKKIISSLKKYFPNINKLSSQQINTFVEYFIFSHFDETIFKILIFFSTSKYTNQVTFESLDLILSFLTMYFLSKRGIRYFLLGKNISRIDKMFNRFRLKDKNNISSDNNKRGLHSNMMFSTRILEFIYLLCKGLNVYELTITEHKVLNRFKVHFIEHLNLFTNADKDNYSMFKTHLSLITSVFLYLKSMYTYDEFEDIKSKIYDIYKTNKLMPYQQNNFLCSFMKHSDNAVEDYSITTPLIKKEHEIEAIIITKHKQENEHSDYINNENVQSINYNPLISENSQSEQSSINNTSSNNIFKNETNSFHIYSISEANSANVFQMNENIACNFLHMIIYRTYYTYKNSIDKYFEFIYTVDELQRIKNQFVNCNISLKIRRYFLNYLRTIYFIDYLDVDDIKQRENALTTLEYIQYENNGDFKSKYQKLQQQEQIIELYIQELTLFPKQLKQFQNNIEDIEAYIFDLLLSIKSIANFYHNEKNIWCKSIVTLYNLTTELAAKMDILNEMFTSLSTSCKLNINDKYNNDIYLENKHYQKLKRRKFDIMNMNQLYQMICIMIKTIMIGTRVEHFSTLENYLREYDTMKDYNFSPPSFLEKNEFDFFYISKVHNYQIETPLIQKITAITENYGDQFANADNTNFLEIISGVYDESDQVDYRKEIVFYFLTIMQSNLIAHTNLYPILCIVNKMLFYDSEGTRKDMKFLASVNNENNLFFTKYNMILHKMFVHTFCTCRNIFFPELFVMYSNITKLLLQFLQLLGNSFDKSFHNVIFTLFKYEYNETIPIKKKELNVNNNDKKEINENNKKSQSPKKNTSIMKNSNNNKKNGSVNVNINEPYPVKKNSDKRKSNLRLKRRTKSMNISPQLSDNIIADGIDLEINSLCLPFYTLVIRNLIYSYNYLNLANQTPFEMPFDKLIVLSNNLIDFIIEYLDVNEEHCDIVNENIEKLFRVNIFKCLLMKSDSNNKLRSDLICFMKSKFLNLVISYFQKGTKREQIRRFTKFLSPSQIFEEILHHMQALFVFMKFQEDLPLYTEKKFKSFLLDQYVFNSEFRNSLQLNLCLQYFILIKFYEEIYGIKTLKEHITKIANLKDIRKEYYGINTKFAYKINLFFEELVLKIDIKRVSKNRQCSNNIETFFIRPHITYYLSNQSKQNFELNVDRTSTSSKMNELLFYSDYFSFEMATNARLLGQSIWSNIMKGILFKYVELISYIMLIIHNIIMIVLKYKQTNLDIEQYNELDTNSLYKYDKPNLILAIVQVVYLIISLVIWLYYKFPLAYMKSLLTKTGKKFIFKKADDEDEKENMQVIKDYFNEDLNDISVMHTIIELNSSISRCKRIYIGIIDAVLTNREICILIYTLIFLIIYLSTACIIWLALPLLFIVNSVPILYNVFKTVKNHFLPLMIIIVFTYICAYNFMWISYHFMSELFYFEVLDYDTGETIEEPFCSSALQCLLHIVEYFVVNCYPDTDYISYKSSTKFYLTNFFYDLFFFIIVSLVMYNVFLGVLYDTFSELRFQLQDKENDINNVCFICQLTRDDSLARRVDFDEHVKKKHDKWNYVYFMIYLHISNSNEFDSIQNYVWDKLIKQENSWIPNCDN